MTSSSGEMWYYKDLSDVKCLLKFVYIACFNLISSIKIIFKVSLMQKKLFSN